MYTVALIARFPLPIQHKHNCNTADKQHGRSAKALWAELTAVLAIVVLLQGAWLATSLAMVMAYTPSNKHLLLAHLFWSIKADLLHYSFQDCVQPPGSNVVNRGVHLQQRLCFHHITQSSNIALLNNMQHHHCESLVNKKPHGLVAQGYMHRSH